MKCLQPHIMYTYVYDIVIDCPREYLFWPVRDTWYRK